MSKRALITGIEGQDGQYLSELLIEQGYDVHGVYRRKAGIAAPVSRRDGVYYHHGNMTDGQSIHRIIDTVVPDEIYNLAAQSHVGMSFYEPEYTADVNALGVLRILESVRQSGLDCRVYQASTSELFGRVAETPQRESTPFYPRSPYGVAKLYGYWCVRNYREAYGMHASNGILFNHESPRRGHDFVTRKITLQLAKMHVDLSPGPLVLGNLDARRDWGHARDYVRAMWLMLQQDTPDDYVIATGEMHTVREFVTLAASVCGTTIEWEGQGVDEVGRDATTGHVLVKVSREFFRPSEVEQLCGDASKARSVLGWTPEYTFEALVEEMVHEDLC